MCLRVCVFLFLFVFCLRLFLCLPVGVCLCVCICQWLSAGVFLQFAQQRRWPRYKGQNDWKIKVVWKRFESIVYISLSQGLTNHLDSWPGDLSPYKVITCCKSEISKDLLDLKSISYIGLQIISLNCHTADDEVTLLGLLHYSLFL